VSQNTGFHFPGIAFLPQETFHFTDHFAPGPAAEQDGQIPLFDPRLNLAGGRVMQKIGEEDDKIHVLGDFIFCDAGLARRPMGYAGYSQSFQLGRNGLDAISANDKN
jgi:hypothetical protein